MGRQADLCWMLGAPEKVQCVACDERFNTYFDDYDIDGGCNPERGLWVLLATCPHCEAEMKLRYRVKLLPLGSTGRSDPRMFDGEEDMFDALELLGLDFGEALRLLEQGKLKKVLRSWRAGREPG